MPDNLAKSFWRTGTRVRQHGFQGGASNMLIISNSTWIQNFDGIRNPNPIRVNECPNSLNSSSLSQKSYLSSLFSFFSHFSSSCCIPTQPHLRIIELLRVKSSSRLLPPLLMHSINFFVFLVVAFFCAGSFQEILIVTVGWWWWEIVCLMADNRRYVPIQQLGWLVGFILVVCYMCLVMDANFLIMIFFCSSICLTS